MELTFWGVRGSFPVAKPHVHRYGGNTSCIQIQKDGHHLVIDAGTGIRGLGAELVQNGGLEHPINLLVSHTHWDHIQGFPFFAPAYSEQYKINIHSVFRPEHSLKSLLAQQQDQNFFPVPLSRLHAEIHFELVEESKEQKIGPFTVSSRRLNHPGVAAGFRIECEGAVISYVSDLAPSRELVLAEFMGDAPTEEKLERLRSNELELALDSDLVIYDTMFTPEEYQGRKHWGHSTPDDGIQTCRLANCDTLFLFHHNPDTSDEELESLVQDYQQRHQDLTIYAAQEGTRWRVAPGECARCD